WRAIGLENRPLADALADAESLTNIYTCGGRYATQLEQYLHHFRGDDLLVLDQHDLRRDRRSVLRRIYSFLDVDPDFWSIELDHELNVNRVTRGTRYAKLRGHAAAGAEALLPTSLRLQLRRAVETVEARLLPKDEPPVLDDDLRARLVELYAPEVERLRAHTGQPFASWSV